MSGTGFGTVADQPRGRKSAVGQPVAPVDGLTAELLDAALELAGTLAAGPRLAQAAAKAPPKQAKEPAAPATTAEATPPPPPRPLCQATRRRGDAGWPP